MTRAMKILVFAGQVFVFFNFILMPRITTQLDDLIRLYFTGVEGNFTNKNMQFVLNFFHLISHFIYRHRTAYNRLDTFLPLYSLIQVPPGITSCRLMKYNNSKLI